jgi:hypothetical protein
MKRRRPSLDAHVLLAPLACFGLAWALGQLSWVEEVEWQTLDVRTRLRAAWDQPPPDERIVVLGIGDRSTQNIEPWPFRRMWHGQLQLLLSHQPPAVLAWDVIFADRVDASGEKWDAESDADFADSMVWLQEAGSAVITAAVSAPDPTGDDVHDSGITWPLAHVTGDLDQLWGDPELVMPYPESSPPSPRRPPPPPAPRRPSPPPSAASPRRPPPASSRAAPRPPPVRLSPPVPPRNKPRPPPPPPGPPPPLA